MHYNTNFYLYFYYFNFLAKLWNLKIVLNLYLSLAITKSAIEGFENLLLT